MLKCASVYTYEIDDPESALAEIKAQFSEKITLLEHSVGIIMCHPEFVTTGVLRHICENLPFDLAGTTTASQAVNDEAGELILTIFVMTSDDVRFKTGVTDSLNDSIDTPTKAAYEKTGEGEYGAPKLAIIFPPLLIQSHTGDAYVKAWKKIIPGTPFFGTFAIDDTVAFNESETIYNGVNNKDTMPFILCYGNINPRFFITTLPKNEAVSLHAEVTKSKDNIVYEINHINAKKFLADSNIPKATLTVPFLIEGLKTEDNDGVPFIGEQAAFTEDGAAVFYGDIDEGSFISLASLKSDDILSASLRGIEQINDLADVTGVLLFSCVVRRIALLGSGKPLAELQIAKDMIRQDIPFMMGYAGGEICPTSVKNNAPVNRYHSYSLVILVL
jgi:hypothetical protein